MNSDKLGHIIQVGEIVVYYCRWYRVLVRCPTYVLEASDVSMIVNMETKISMVKLQYTVNSLILFALIFKFLLFT